MGAILQDAGVVAGVWRLIACTHGKELMELHPGESLFQTLDHWDWEWIMVVNSRTNTIMMECKKCCGGL